MGNLKFCMMSIGFGLSSIKKVQDLADNQHQTFYSQKNFSIIPIHELMQMIDASSDSTVQFIKAISPWLVTLGQ